MEDSECLRIYQECRGILREPDYSPQLSARLIGWLKHPNAAVADIAGQCLLQLGPRAFDDLLAEVTSANALPWPNAVWVLAGISPCSDRLLPLLRSWLSSASGELEHQCAVSLAHAIIARKREGHPPHPDDVTACTRVFERSTSENPGMRVHYRGFLAGLKAGPAA